MKHQQVSVDFVSMVFTAYSYLALAGAVWIFLRLIQACFWLPRHLKRQNQVQQMLQDKVENYEKYIMECEEKEKLEHGEEVKNPEQAEKWKERRECLAMLKKELNRVHDGRDEPQDWDYLLEEEETEEKADMKEIKGDETSKNGPNDETNTDTTAVNETVSPENKKDK